jgi:pilus assembly protein CpaB
MNRRLLTILLIAFFIAAACTLLIAHLVRNQASGRQPVTTLVVAAKTDIKLGTILTADNITTLGITGTPPKEAILEKDMKSVIGRGVVADLYEGEPIIESRLALPGSGG